MWYPRIAVYDNKFGWTTDQHLGKEFYGDFGTWDVELTFASNYVVEATGALQNRSEVMPDELRKKLDLKNFANKAWNSAPSIIIPYDSLSRKTWIYHVKMCMILFTADLLIGLEKQNGMASAIAMVRATCIKMAKCSSIFADVIRVFSEDIACMPITK